MTYDFRVVETDILVIGAGGAGTRAAIEAAKQGANVAIVSIGPIGKSGSTGGTAGGVGAPRLPLSLEGTVEAEGYLCDQNLVEVYNREIADRFQDLKNWGKTDLTMMTCKGQMLILRGETLRHPNIRVMEDTVTTKLLTKAGRVVGAVGLDMRSGELVAFKAKAVILATGGWLELYPYTTAFPQYVASYGWSGDGQVLAYDVGAELVEMEMMQFTVTFREPKIIFGIRHFEVAGKAKSEYGYDSRVSFGYNLQYGPYVNARGETLFTREEVHNLPSRTYSYITPIRIMKEIAEGRGPVYVTLPPVGEYKKILELEGSDQEVIDFYRNQIGLDITKYDKLEVCFGAHCALGGIKVNDKNETNVPGLYAAGEAVGNLYGACRNPRFMPSTSEIMVFGANAGRHAAEYAKKTRAVDIDLDEVEKERERINAFKKPKRNGVSPLEVKKKIKEVAGKYLFFPRNAKGLKEAIAAFERIGKNDLPRMQVVDVKRYNMELLDALGASILVKIGGLVAQSALFRTESRGFHYRDDYPETDWKNWTVHTLVKLEKGKMKLEKAPVVVTKVKPPTR